MKCRVLFYLSSLFIFLSIPGQTQELGVSGRNVPKVIDYTAISNFTSGYAVVRKGENYALIDDSGNEFIPLGTYKFSMEKESYGSNRDQAGFYNGMCIVKNPDTEKFGYIDSTGKLVVPCIFREAYPFREDGYAYAKFMDWDKSQHFNYFFDKTGRRFPVKSFNEADNGSPFISTEGRDLKTTIFYRKTGQKAFETQYRSSNYGEGLYLVTQFLEGNVVKYGFMDTTGKLVVPFLFTGRFNKFSDGLALYQPKLTDEYEYSYVNKKGEEVVFLKKQNGITDFYQPTEFSYGYATVQVTANGKRKKALVDKAGNITILEDLFIRSNPLLIKDLSDVRKSNFTVEFRDCNEWGIFVDCYFALKPNSATARLFDNGKTSATGGVGGGQQFVEVRGRGMIDYKGKLTIFPMYENIGPFDPKSGLAKVIFATKENGTVQGFINKAGELSLLMKNNISNFIAH